jgi:hypothetical protein
LCRQQEIPLGEGEVRCKIFDDSFWRENEKAISEGPQFGDARRRPVGLSETSRRFTFVWGEGSDIDEAHNFGVVASFSYDRATVGMPYQKNRAILGIDDPFGSGDVFCERRERILDADDVKALLLKYGDDLGPA